MKDEIKESDIVVSRMGRDKNRLMFVIAVLEDGRLALADGRLRKVENPKVKKAKHVALFSHDDGRVAQKICLGEKLANSEIRRELAHKTLEQTS